jgi:hypothetical protein
VKLHDNPALIQDFIDKGVRYVKPVIGLPRRTADNVELGGTTLPRVRRCCRWASGWSTRRTPSAGVLPARGVGSGMIGVRQHPPGWRFRGVSMAPEAFPTQTDLRPGAGV